MINFDDLEIGKDYIFMNRKYLYDTYYWKPLKIIKKGKHIPVNGCKEIIENNIYDYVVCMNKEGNISMVSKYKDEHLEYYYLTPFENPSEVLSQFTEIINTYKQDELDKINTRLNEEKISLEDDLNKKIQKFQENLLNQFKPKDESSSKKKKKKDREK